MLLSGLRIERTGTGFKAHQNDYISKLAKININRNFADFRCLRAKLVCASNSRSDIICSAAELTQKTEEMFRKETLL